MASIVSIHSFRGGTGKSNITANVGAALAGMGLRVGIIDTDIQSPGIHVIFGLDESTIKRSLNDYLWGRCEIEEAAYDVTPSQIANKNGKILLIPSSINVGEITRILREGYNIKRLHDGFKTVGERLKLDYLLIDTHPGLNEETLLSITISNTLLIILRPDRQDFQGTAVTVDVARKLKVSNLFLIVNRVLEKFDVNEVRQQVEKTYSATVAGVLHNSDDMMELASSDLFYLRYPDHPFAKEIGEIAKQVNNKI